VPKKRKKERKRKQQQMLVGMEGERNPYILLAGMEISTATMEISVAVPEETI
jgi:hypothetical protein